MSDLFRETAFGQIIRFLSGRRLLRYPEELPGFEFTYPESRSPDKSVELNLRASLELTSDPDPEKADSNGGGSSTPNSETLASKDAFILVDWYNSGQSEIGFLFLVLPNLEKIDDPANPHNWAGGKKVLVAAEIWSNSHTRSLKAPANVFQHLHICRLHWWCNLCSKYTWSDGRIPLFGNRSFSWTGSLCA